MRRFLAEHGHTLTQVEEAETYLEFFLDRHATLAGRVDVIMGTAMPWRSLTTRPPMTPA